MVEHIWNMMAHMQKADLVFQRNGHVHLNQRGGGGGGVKKEEEGGERGGGGEIMISWKKKSGATSKTEQE